MYCPLDVNFLGHPNIIASCLLDGGSAGLALIDPGPSTSLDGLAAALAAQGRELAEVDAILLTHIHLDHAGATGTILARHPRIRVYVHEIGAPHVADPQKLLASASRLYGDQMRPLWGEVRPVPASAIHPLRGGEVIDVAGRPLGVAHTPGHASHHVSYFDPDDRTAFVGDSAGVRIGPALMVMPPTPPPDVDLDAWQVSIERMLAWKPERLFLTHFGTFSRPAEHLGELRARIREFSALVEAGLQDASQDDARRMARFAEASKALLVSEVGEEGAIPYSLAIPYEHCWMGLARYLRKRALQAVQQGGLSPAARP